MALTMAQQWRQMAITGPKAAGADSYAS